MYWLTEDQFEHVRSLFNGGMSSSEIAGGFGSLREVRAAIVAPSYKKYINSPVAKYLTDADPPMRYKRLSHDEVCEIWALRGLMTHAALAHRFGVSRATIDKIYAGKRWAHLHPNYEANKGENRPAR
jgi:hypothetical protein